MKKQNNTYGRSVQRKGTAAKRGNTAGNRKSFVRKKKNTRWNIYVKAGIVVLILLTAALLIYSCLKKIENGTGVNVDASQPEIDVQLLTINEYSRPGIESDGITGIVIHYTANPGTSAQANRDYFEGLKDSGETSASSNFVIGLEGEIIQCVPTWEVAYASNSRNNDTISIECCHPDASGKFTEETYRSVVQLTAWLCKKYNLTQEDVIRHYDVTGKICPKYFVDHEDAWLDFRADVAAALEKGGAD